MPEDTVIEEVVEINEEVTITFEEEEEEPTNIIENDAAEVDELIDPQPTEDFSHENDQDSNQENTSEIIVEEEQKTEAPIEHIDIEFSVLNLEIGSKAPSEIKILDMLGDSPEEKVFETLQVNQDNSLKDRIHTEMTSSLAETLPLFQKINFIQNLFDGESRYLDQVIQFIDHEANKSTDWKSILQTKYAAFQRVDNQELWNELYELIERKFS
jgi:hypothetical protein